MIVNLDKFQAIVLEKGYKNSSTLIHDKFKLHYIIKNNTINTSKSVELLGIMIDYKLNFEEYIAVRCKKIRLQLNTISRLQKYMGKKEKEAIVNSFVFLGIS